MKSLVLILTTCTCLVRCLPPPHPDVVAVQHEENLIHPALRSSALRNPHLLKILPLTSLLHEGEMLVTEREASKISPVAIYKALTHAGLLPRKAYSLGENHKPREVPIIFPETFLAPSFFSESDWEPYEWGSQYL